MHVYNKTIFRNVNYVNNMDILASFVKREKNLQR